MTKIAVNAVLLDRKEDSTGRRAAEKKNAVETAQSEVLNRITG
ncbi:MAG: hypothetical protein ACI4D7_07740 [Lachnospiraceae bacterium]